MLHSNAQDNGALLAVHDEANEHVLYVWDWQKQKKVAESKVRVSLLYGCLPLPLPLM